MAPLIVPTLSPSGALHFAAVQPNATAQDVIDALSGLDEVRDEVLGDLPDNGWAVQRIRRKLEPGSRSETHLVSPGHGLFILSGYRNTEPFVGLLHATDSIESIMAASKPPSLQRHFSAFPLSSHLHAPSIRLVSLHPLLRLSIQCIRIPEYEEDLEVEWFLARSTTVEDVISGVIEEIGLPKVISGPGGGAVDYVLEEAWIYGEEEGMHTCAYVGNSLMYRQL
jgi:diaphanous 1